MIAVFRTRNIHTPFRPFIYVRLLRVSFLTLVRMFAGTFFRTRNIHTLHSPVSCLCGPLGCFGVFVMFVGVVFKTRNIHTPFRLFIVTVRHEPSRIVAIRANVATRLKSSRSANFFKGRCALPEVHFRSPLSRHDFRCDGRDSR